MLLATKVLYNPRECMVCKTKMRFGVNPLCQDCDPTLEKERESVAVKYALAMVMLRGRCKVE